MMTKTKSVWRSLGLAAAVGAFGGLSGAVAAETAPPTVASNATPGAASPELNPRLLRRFSPARSHIDAPAGAASDAAVQLGRMLFFDQRLSKNGDLSCNSCHQLDKYGVDGLRTSTGAGGKKGKRNAPTVYHAAGFFQQFWDGRAQDVEEQAKGPITNPNEMAMANGDAVVKVLNAIPGYVDAFKNAFPGDAKPVSYDNVGRAIGAFERLLTTKSRWDQYLGGDKSALSAEEKEGLKVFTNIGCMVCHTGEMLGGNSFQKLGSVEAWPNQVDQGRFEVTKIPIDKMMFKVPTLRNVAMTGPYFHDGSAATLDDAVRLMGRHQLGLDLTAEEVKSMVTWLKSLTGTLPPGELISQPALPPGANKVVAGGKTPAGTKAKSR
jgi:cytochrome c peroxidase